MSIPPPTHAELASLDGRVASVAETGIPVTDQGLLHADGAFEVVRIYAGRPLALRAHLDRLARSAKSLRLDDMLAHEVIERDVVALLHARGGSAFDGLVRIVLTRGGHRLLVTEPLPPQLPEIRLGFVDYDATPLLDGVKSLSYASNVLAGRIAREQGFDEALFVSAAGRVREAPTASFFYVLGDGALCTPPLSEHILASITRAILIDRLDVRERSVTAGELTAEAEEAFLASTTREVQPVSVIEDRQLVTPGQMTIQASNAFRAHVAHSLDE